jgi:ribosomal protein L32E
MPKIGYGSNKKTKHMMPNGLKSVVVSNIKDVSIEVIAIRWGRSWIGRDFSGIDRPGT